MSHVYVLTNQHQQFLSKSSEWVDGRDANRLFRSEYKDVAINQMFEANTRNVSLRIELLQCELNAKGQPQIPEEALGEIAIVAEQGEPEIEPGSPQEMPPESNPEVSPEPAPEVEPEEAPEVAPEEVPEIEPQQPDEAEGDEAKAAVPEAG